MTCVSDPIDPVCVVLGRVAFESERITCLSELSSAWWDATMIAHVG